MADKDPAQKKVRGIKRKGNDKLINYLHYLRSNSEESVEKMRKMLRETIIEKQGKCHPMLDSKYVPQTRPRTEKPPDTNSTSRKKTKKPKQSAQRPTTTTSTHQPVIGETPVANAGPSSRMSQLIEDAVKSALLSGYPTPPEPAPQSGAATIPRVINLTTSNETNFLQQLLLGTGINRIQPRFNDEIIDLTLSDSD